MGDSNKSRYPNMFLTYGCHKLLLFSYYTSIRHPENGLSMDNSFIDLQKRL